MYRPGQLKKSFDRYRFADKVYARHSYLPDEIHWDKQFEDILFELENGRRFVDLRKFHDVKDMPKV